MISSKLSVKKNPVKPIRPYFFSFTYSVGLGRLGFNYDKLRIIKVEKLSISCEYENKYLLYNSHIQEEIEICENIQ